MAHNQAPSHAYNQIWNNILQVSRRPRMNFINQHNSKTETVLETSTQ